MGNHRADAFSGLIRTTHKPNKPAIVRAFLFYAINPIIRSRHTGAIQENLKMETVIKIRPAKLLLQWILDPTASYDFSRDELQEMCGIIPDFFAEAVLQEKAGTIEEAAQVMDDCYQMGGFNQYPFSGTLDMDGIYHGDGDDPLPPLLKLRALDDPDDSVTCYVYPYGIVAVATLYDSKIARFD